MIYLNTGDSGGGTIKYRVTAGRSYDYDLSDIKSITIWGDENDYCNLI